MSPICSGVGQSDCANLIFLRLQAAQESTRSRRDRSASPPHHRRRQYGHSMVVLCEPQSKSPTRWRPARLSLLQQGGPAQPRRLFLSGHSHNSLRDCSHRRPWPMCACETCRWLFLATSNNNTRHWCDMKVCGNRMKARRFNARRETRCLEARLPGIDSHYHAQHNAQRAGEIQGDRHTATRTTATSTAEILFSTV
jgi:hypothetical protein